jgi:CCR4-NOT transcription complex subunit 4
VKRAKEKKTRKAKTIKQLDAMGRRNLLGVRVVMKNMVYVDGMKIPGTGDEVSPLWQRHKVFRKGKESR